MTGSASPLPGQPRTLVIGVGNGYRGDDAVGLMVAQRLQEEHLDHVTIVSTTGEGTALLALWQDTDAVVLVDAVCAGARPGTLQRFVVGTEPLPAMFSRVSTHAFGVALVVYGVEGATFEAGVGLSAAVAAAVPQVIAQVRQELLALTDGSTLRCVPPGSPPRPER
jgi:hydrogenase maturation protease